MDIENIKIKLEHLFSAIIWPISSFMYCVFLDFVIQYSNLLCNVMMTLFLYLNWYQVLGCGKVFHECFVLF